MADTDLGTILARVRAVLEAAPLSLSATTDGFSHSRQPASLVDNTYYVEDGGFVSSRPVGNFKAVRIDRITVFVALRLTNAPHTRKETLEATLVSIERYVKADGVSHSYRAEIGGGRRITNPKGSALLIGSLSLTVDYDINEGTT